MTNSITLTHSEAVKLSQELTQALNDNNLDTIQIVSTQTDISVVRLERENGGHPYSSNIFTVEDHPTNY